MNYLEKELVERVQGDNIVYDFMNSVVLDGTWFWDLENPENEWMSPNFWTTLGYDPSEMPHKASAWQNIIHPDDFILAKENLIKHFNNPEHPYDQVVRYNHKNGHTVWIRCKGFCIRDENGKPTRMLGVHTKVSALILKQIEESSTEANNRASVLSSVLNGKQNENLNEINNRNLIHANLDKLVKSENETFLVNKGHSFKELSEKTKIQIKKEILRENFKKYPSELVGFLFVEREYEPRIESFISDVSERIDLKELIKKRDDLLSMLADNTSDTLLIFNNKMELTYASPSFERITGKQIDKFPMNETEALDYIHPDDLNFVLESYFNAVSNKNKELIIQHRAIHATEGDIWLEDYANFEYDENLNHQKTFIISRDITKRKILEIKLKEESEKRRQIAELLIESKEKSKEDLYKELHDGVNQLLFASKLNIENAGHKDNKNLNQALEYLTTAIEEIRKIALESTSQFIFNDCFVSAIIDYFLKINITSKVKFMVDNRINENLIIDDTIRKHIFRICQELAQNAIKHSQGTKMSFRFLHQDGNLILIAKDNGIGFQNSKSEGIGLKSIKDRVYLLNGKIRIFNNLFQGMTIYIEVKLK
ncbi:MAG: PAS domain S-box protein [Flavobacteriales bacterium]|nr:PAS domain S-box protein [Flavobacteriales bacterium]